MKKLSLVVMTLVMLTSLNAVAQVEDFDINVGDFTQLVVDNNIDVVYKPSTTLAGHVQFKATKKVANNLIFKTSKKKLTIQVAEDMMGKDQTPLLTVYSSTLVFAENNADSTVTVFVPKGVKEFTAVSSRNGDTKLEEVDVEKLTVRIKTGWGDIYASGKCDLLVVRGLGTGDLNVQELEARNADVRYTGRGVVRCDVTNELKLKGAGGANVLCKKLPAKVSKAKLLRGIKLGLLGDEKK
ncbi:GIN domain-containing protein [Sodaliphilus sp.]|uniref:GIN domain-containing protein n=1 Tax=Sodaliphilus sp. TaxID=2815818 RepID=UPI00388DCC95